MVRVYKHYTEVSVTNDGVHEEPPLTQRSQMVEPGYVRDINVNREEALEFLALHQPMPEELDITQELINKYDEVRIYFTTHPDKDAIPLFLQSFGEGNGLGVYQLVEDFFDKCCFDDVVTNISAILENPHTIKSVRLWCTLLTISFPDRRLINGLNISIQSNDEDTHDMAQLGLEMIAKNVPNNKE